MHQNNVIFALLYSYHFHDDANMIEWFKVPRKTLQNENG